MIDILAIKKGDTVYYHSKYGGIEKIIVHKLIKLNKYQHTFKSIGCIEIMVKSKKGNIYDICDLKLTK